MKLEIERTFDAPREAVFREWTTPESLAGWFAPNDFTVTEATMDARVGGSWRVAYRNASGDEAWVETGEILELEAPSHLVFTLTQTSARTAGPKTTVTVRLTDVGGRTQMKFEQTGFTAPEHRDGNAEGWGECLDQLEIRLLFAAWFDASERKDLDAAMAPIAEDIVSYEHGCEVEGVEAVRKICAAGFGQMPAGFRWDMPKIQIRMQNTLAIAWGLNRIRWPGGEVSSRSTRVFEKRQGHWRLVHQHLSLPVTPHAA